MTTMWSILLYLSIPTALALLAVILFCHGIFQRLNDLAMLLVGRFIFARFNVLPFPLIQLLLVLHVLTALVMGTSVYNWHQSHPKLSPNAPLDVVVSYNGKAWRQQRNLYLICLSLVLWWSAQHQPQHSATHSFPHLSHTLHSTSKWPLLTLSAAARPVCVYVTGCCTRCIS